MGRGKDYTTNELAEIKGYLKDGCSQEEIAELMGRSKKSIQNTILRQGWTRGRFRDENPDNQPWSEVLKDKAEPSIQFPEQTAEEPVEKVTEEVKQAVEVMQGVVKPVKEKTLDDFPPRELIKNLYERGYRIENGKLICIVHQVVNVKDIING